MATLVLSTVGNALGGPVGGAIGALIGQSIDQEVLAPASRGPRVGDLSVQTSSYGTPIPRVYGTMRVAGTVIWATDLIEHLSTDGAKGQPDVAYSYTVSMAVALSSRTASSIGRIWADGNLLRGAAGDLKVSGKLRFYDGGDDQIVDPLIASVEGIENTPAYRGLVLAVFEDLELAAFSNRIPSLTFEVIADPDEPAIGSIIEDASGGAISSDSAQTMIGYAAYGKSIADAAGPLIDCFGIELFDNGTALQASSNAEPTVVDETEFGNSADQQQVSRVQREQASSRSLPATLRLTYYDAARDFQTGEARAVSGERDGLEVRQDLAATLDASTAKALAQSVIVRSWAQRDKLTLRLPPKRVDLQPGNKLILPLTPAVWTVDQVTIDGLVVVAELHPWSSISPTIAADGGRAVSAPDVVAGPVSLALLDVPNVLGLSSANPTILLAASSATPGWSSHAVELSFNGQSIATQTAHAKSVLGQAVTALSSGTPELIDETSTVEVSLIDPTQWLTSCDDDALVAGRNLAVLGNEVIQFGVATSLGGGRFALSRLLRGRGGTEWACGSHLAGETFCVLDGGSIHPVALPTWSIGANLTATDASGATASAQYSGERLRPLSPVALTAERQDDGGLSLSWIRRSRQGFAWNDGVDVPIGEASERYRVTLTGSTSIEIEVTEPFSDVAAHVVSTLGAGSIVIQVGQIGDFAVSRPTQITL